MLHAVPFTVASAAAAGEVEISVDQRTAGWRRYAGGRPSRLKVRRRRGKVKAAHGRRLAIV